MILFDRERGRVKLYTWELDNRWDGVLDDTYLFSTFREYIFLFFFIRAVTSMITNYNEEKRKTIPFVSPFHAFYVRFLFWIPFPSYFLWFIFSSRYLEQKPFQPKEEKLLDFYQELMSFLTSLDGASPFYIKKTVTHLVTTYLKGKEASLCLSSVSLVLLLFSENCLVVLFSLRFLFISSSLFFLSPFFFVHSCLCFGFCISFPFSFLMFLCRDSSNVIRSRPSW